MKFFSFFYNSLFNISWLRQRKNEPGKSWGYFFVFCLLLSLVSAIVVTAALPGVVKELKTSINEKIPANFSAEIVNGKLGVTGLPQPYVFTDQAKNNFVAVVDTVSTSSLDLKKYLSSGTENAILIDSEKIEIFNGEKNQGQIQYWKDVPNLGSRVDKNFLASLLNKVGPAFLFFAFLTVFFGTFVVLVIGRLFSILIVSLIVLIVAAIARHNWKFGELFSVGLCAVTIPSLISLVFSLLGISVPFVHFLALLAFMLAVVFTKVPAGDLASPNKTEDNNIPPEV
jgi:maltodextrin utilization protein YvdJ